VFSFRPAELADAEAVGACAAAAFEGYRGFAPPFWRAPDVASQVAHFRRLFESGRLWSLLAERDGELAGQVSFVPASASPLPSEDPALAHLSGLFVDERWWGSGLARTLHSRVVEEASAREFTRMRLFTPVGQARARRFYEREGWVVGSIELDLAGGLPAIEYQRDIP
jgi:GNAT superfamily N-acetyltransferase